MAFLTFKEILELIDRVAERGIGAVEIESAGVKVRVEGKRSEIVVQGGQQPAGPGWYAPAPAQHASGSEAQLPQSAPPTEEESEAGLHIVTSPIVGTFYRAPNPEADSFVSVGSRIAKGDVLCIIEAMKLMNEIEADIEGTIAKIYPQNGQPIEFGEKLFAVRLG